MRDTLNSIIPVAIQIASSLEQAIRFVDEEVAKGDCSPVPKEIRDEEIKAQWQGHVDSKRWHILNQVAKKVLNEKGTLRDAIRLAKQEEGKSFVPFPRGDILKEEIKRLWVKEARYQNVFLLRQRIEEITEAANSYEEAIRLVGELTKTFIAPEEVTGRIKTAWQKKEEVKAH